MASLGDFTRGSPASLPAAQPGEAVQLPLKTTSFKQWSEFLQGMPIHLGSSKSAITGYKRPASSFLACLWIILTVLTVASLSTVSVSLSVEETVHCYKRCLIVGPTMYCSQHWCRPLQWTKGHSLLVDLEGTDEKQSQTISIYRGQSAGLHLPSAANFGGFFQPGEPLRTAPECPRGIGYGVLR